MGPADVLRHVIHQLFQKRGILDGGSYCRFADHGRNLKTHVRMKHIVLANELISKDSTNIDKISCLILAF